METRLDFPGYCITEQLYVGSRTLVYRGICAADQQSVVIKLLRNELPSFSELVQFRNQYTLARSLNLPGIIRVHRLEPYRNSYALVMEDFGGVALSKYLANGFKAQRMGSDSSPRPFPVADFFPIALQLCDSLNGLYRHRIIHKDIKPANILINPDTQQVKLIDFSIASLLPRETQEIQSPTRLEGTLAYLSPEQTGRMNRGIDYRSDFYSLGVTLYELLAGRLPFESSDPMELVHSHLAKQPLPLDQVNPAVPAVLAAIVGKLMAKNAEDRYQSALGLKHDLEQCELQWQSTGTVAPFNLGQRDWSDRFLIPEKLYGREPDVAALLAAFERVAGGQSELMLVAGFSGIGKTAVVKEVHKPIARGARTANVRQRGYFIKGKYDQFQRNVPFSALVQAFRDLMGQLLSESDAQLQTWKAKILEAVGDNGQVLIEVIPELEQIVGKQLPVTGLAGTAAQNRFNLLMQRFVQVFTSPDHPLVMFVDDLQWADPASLTLLQLLLQDTTHLLILGAYRDNEVSPVHPFMLTIDAIVNAGVVVNTITLQPLSVADMNQLVTETLNCVGVADAAQPHALAQPLTELIYQKTQGNPFFATQFLKALHEDETLVFDWNTQSWQCDIAQVKTLSLTDDVVEFMAAQLQKLPAETQQKLQLAACIGAQFDLQTLAIVSEQSPEKTATELWRALQEGLIIPITEVYKVFTQLDAATPSVADITVNPAYRFLHDRVQQAAYSLIPAAQNQAVHLKIGRLLRQNTSPDTIEARIFDIVNQLNIGVDQMTQLSEREDLAQLNLVAGKKAKVSTAYKAAIEYLTLGRELLSETSWATRPLLAFELHRQCAECDYLTGNFDRAEQLFDLALTQTQDPLAQAEVYGIQMYLKMTQGENIAAGLTAGLTGLSIIGLSLPLTPAAQQTAIAAQLQDLNMRLAAVNPAELLSLPEMTDPTQKACMSLLSDLWAGAYMTGDANLSALAPLMMINLSLSHGHAESSGFAYCLYGMSLANRGDYSTAYEFGSLALNLDRHFNSDQFIFKTNNIFGHTINPYHRHLKTNLPLYQQSFQMSQAAGNLVYGVWAVSFIIWVRLIKGDYLPDVFAETEKYLSYVQQVNDVNMRYALMLQRQFVLHLQGLETATDLLDDRNALDPADLLPDFQIQVWRQERNFDHGINWFCFLKLQLAYLEGRYADAVAAAVEAEATLAANAGFFPIMQYHFYYPLSLAALYSTATAAQKTQYWQILQQQQQQLQDWAAACPENFLHRSLLLAAEMARLTGDRIEASGLYDRAIALANEHQFTNEAALANELAAKFYLQWEKERIAQTYLIDAYYAYGLWGATAKVADLEQHYPQLLEPILQTQSASGDRRSAASPLSTSSNIPEALDLATVLKVSQALSSEIESEKLLERLLQIMLEHAGAEKCVLLLMQQEENLWVNRVATVTTPAIAQVQIPVEQSQDVPLGLIYQVKRSLETVVLTHGAIDSRLANDPYILRHQTKSILCSPILNQGRLVGMLYLENNLATGVFTRDRVELLNLLCAQAAISLETARLYERSQRALAELQASETRFQTMASNIPGMVYQYRIAPDGSGTILYASPGCRELYESEPEEIMSGRVSLDAMVHPDDRATMDAFSSQSVQSQSQAQAQAQPTVQFEFRMVLPSGITKWVQTFYRPNQQPDGAIVWDGVTFDISDRKRAEQAQARLLAIVEATPDLVGFTDAVGNNLYLNPAGQRLLEVPAAEMDQFHISEFTAASMVTALETEMLPTTIREGVWSGESIVRNRSGTEIPVSQVMMAHKNAQGEPEFFSTIVRDIRDRKQTERQLQEAQQFLRLLLDNIPQLVFWKDRNSVFMGCNINGARFAGLESPELIVGKNDYELLGTVEEANGYRACDRRIMDSGQAEFHIIETQQRPDGSLSWLDTSKIPLRDPEGNVIGILVTVDDISDRKAAERQLQESQQLLELVLNTIPHKVFWKDRDSNLLGWNRAFGEVMGYSSPAELVGKTDEDMPWTAEEAEGYRADDRRIMQADRPELNILETQVQLDGRLAWVETSKVPLHDADGAVIGLLGVYQDVTDRKQAEANLQQALNEREYQSRLLQTVLDSTQAWIFAKDFNYRYIMVNRSYADAIGQTVESMLGRSDLDLGFPEELVLGNPAKGIRGFRVDDCRALAGEQVRNSYDLCTIADGSCRIFDSCKTPLYDVDGSIFAVLGFSNDITDRYNAEAALQEQEQFLRSIYDGTEIVISVIEVRQNSKFYYAGWNAIAEQVTGIPSTDAIGKTPIEVLGAGKGRAVQKKFAEIVHTGFSLSYEESITLEGQETWWLVSLNPVRNPAGEIHRIIGTALNISDRKRAEAELNQQTLALEQTLQQLQRTQTQMIQSEKMSGLGQLVAGVAHEINNPVNFIFGNLNHADEYIQDLLGLVKLYQQHYPTPDPEIQQQAETIDLEFLTEDLPKLLTSMKVGADRIKLIVASLRNFSRMDEAEMKSVDIHDGLNSTLMILQHRLKPKIDTPEIKIIKAYGDFPPIECYAGQLNQVFMNLLSNAIDALEEASSTGRTLIPTITIRTSLVNAQQVAIQISDNGPGIPESIRPRLFDPFFTTKPVGKGTGMGLSISYQIVTEKHQGTLRCVSAPGQGAAFIVTIPIRQSSKFVLLE